MQLKKIIVTAGPTREHLDPVRFLSNPSTGKMGFAVAAAAAKRGYDVTLIAGPVSLATPPGVKRVDVVSAREMFAAVKAAAGAPSPETACSATAAVADWRPAECAKRKLKKSEMSATLRLVRNPDILKSVKGVRKVGFAAETGDPGAEAVRKCREKKLEFIVANDVTAKGCGFGTSTNRVLILNRDGSMKKLPLMSKRRLAEKIIDQLEFF